MSSFEAGQVQRPQLETEANASWQGGNITHGWQATPSYLYLTDLASVLLILGGLVGNGIVIWFLGFCAKTSPFSTYILNLVTGDFIFLLATSLYPQEFANSLYLVELSQIISSVNHTVLWVRQCLLVAVSTERCVSVLWPLWYKCQRPAHLSTIVCALLWGLYFGFVWMQILCSENWAFFCHRIFLVNDGVIFGIFPGLCVTSLTLFVRMRCCSWRGQGDRLCGTILLTVLTFLLLILPDHTVFVIKKFTGPHSQTVYQIQWIFSGLLRYLRSAVNPVLFYCVGRHRQQRGRKTLRAVLQSALTDEEEGSPSPDRRRRPRMREGGSAEGSLDPADQA